MIYQVITSDKCLKSDVSKICSGASNLYMRGQVKTSTDIFKVLEKSNLIKCEW